MGSSGGVDADSSSYAFRLGTAWEPLCRNRQFARVPERQDRGSHDFDARDSESVQNIQAQRRTGVEYLFSILGAGTQFISIS